MDLSNVPRSQLEKDISELHEALYKGSEETVRLRLNKIIEEVNKLTNSDYKKIVGGEEIIKTIFENRISFSIIGDYAIFIVYAVNTTKDYIFKLISPEELNSRGCFKRTALHYAVQKQLADVVRLLLEAGANVNCITDYGFTPLHLAAALQNEEICEILLNFGAKIVSNLDKFDGILFNVCGMCSLKEHLVKPAKHFDAFYHSEYDFNEPQTLVFNRKITKLLIDRGADPNQHFLILCQFGILEPLNFLLQFGASTSYRDKEGNSALHYAAAGHSLEVVEFLLEKGLDINIRSKHNLTPLFFMLEMNCIRESYSDLIEYLVDRGADMNARFNSGDTLLNCIFAIGETRHDVECLLELGANFKLDCKDRLDLLIHHPNLNVCQEILISFIALHENELTHYFNCCFREVSGELPKALVYFEKSRLEVEKLKSRRIVKETTVSFYDFLSGGFYNAAQLVKNEEIKKVFVSREYYKEFSFYSFLLEKRFERVIILKDAVNKMESFLINCLSILPTLVHRKILNLFRSSDFRRFEHGLFSCQNLVEREADSNLEFGKMYPAEIVEIREIGVMVTLYPGMTPALLHYSKIDNFFGPHGLEDIGKTIMVDYQGRHLPSGRIILKALINHPFF